MSTLKVGDITITPDGIQFNNAASQSGQPQRPPQAQKTALQQPQQSTEPSRLALLIQRRPWILVPLLVLGLTGLTVAVGSTALTLYFGVPMLMLAIPVVLLPIGFIMGFMVLLGDRAAEKAAAAESEAAEATPTISPQVARIRAERLLPLLAEGSDEMTVERLVQRSGLNEQAVVDTLTALTDQGQVDEELNVETGEWFYQLLQVPESEEPPMSLSERRARLAKNKMEQS